MKTPVGPKRKKSSVNEKKGAFLSPRLQLVLFILAHILIFLVLFNTFYKTPYSATSLYFNYASNIMHGSIPYRDFSFEYPPFALLFFILPRLVSSTFLVFAIVYELEVLIFSLVGLFVVYRIAGRLGKAPWKLLTVYTLSVLAIGPIIAQQYDIFPAIMVLLALYYFWIGQHKTSWVLLALGTLTKVFPVAIAPVFLIYYLRNRQYKYLWSGIIAFAVVCLLIATPFLTIGQDAIRNLISYHAQRGLQIESTYSAFLLAADKLGLTSVSLVFNFGSWNLDGPLANMLAKLSTYLLAIFLLLVYWFIYSRMRPGKSQFTRLGAYSLLVITTILIASKVFSPQYLIWLVPLFALLLNRWRYTILITFIFVGGLTYCIFPVYYLYLLSLNSWLVAGLLIRDILLILLAVFVGVSLLRMKASD